MGIPGDWNLPCKERRMGRAFFEEVSFQLKMLLFKDLNVFAVSRTIVLEGWEGP